MTVSPRRSCPDFGVVLPDLLLLSVHLALAASFIRLYDGAFFGDLAAFVVVASATAFCTRRVDLPTGVAVLVPAVGAVLVSTWLLFPETTTWALPTGRTGDAVGYALEEARAGIEVIVAPSEVLVGFQLVAGLALWSSVWFADWAAFRLRTPVEAIVPAAVIFVFGAVLGSGEHQIWTTVAFATTCLLFIAAHRASEARVGQAWIASSNARGSWALLRVGVGLALVGILAGAALGPLVPGSGSDPVVAWREGSDGPRDRVALSPIVDLRRRLVDQTDVQLFTVATDRPAYWRTTALDQFDGQLWTSGGTYRPADRSLEPRPSGPSPSLTSVQSYEMDVLGSIFLPVAFEPRALEESSHPLRWEPESSTLIVDSDIESVDGVSYRIQSAIPSHSAADLRAAVGPDPAEVQERFESLPPDLPPEVATLAAEVTSGATSRYDQALALQNWFRTEFDYTLETPAGHDDDAISAFLRDRAGYCEQFAGTYAAMARSLGIPSRVAIGFTPGEPHPVLADTFVVRGRHAHAWPEVWFPEVGWVAFEPTPGRGLPDGESYTGVPPQQDDGQQVPAPPPATTTTVVAPTPSTVDATSTTSTVPAPADDTERPDDREDRRAALPGWLPWIGGAGLVSALWIGLALWLPERRRRRTMKAEPETAILLAWRDGVRAVARLTGDRQLPHETHEDLARRAGPGLEPTGLREPFGQLAALATTAAWRPSLLGEDQRDRAVELSTRLHRETAAREAPARRLLRRLSWRNVVGAD